MYIFLWPGLASCRCRPLSSNVRQHMAAESASRCLLEYQIQAPALGHSASPRKRGKLICRSRSADSTSALRAVPSRSARLEAMALASCTDEPRGSSTVASIPETRTARPAAWRLHPGHVGVAGEAVVASHPAKSPRLSRVLPNPSLKPSPNSKPPGPRYSAVHHLQRGPGVFLSGPA